MLPIFRYLSSIAMAARRQVSNVGIMSVNSSILQATYTDRQTFDIAVS